MCEERIARSGAADLSANPMPCRTVRSAPGSGDVLVDAEVVALGILEPGRLLRAEDADMVDCFQAGKTLDKALKHGLSHVETDQRITLRKWLSFCTDLFIGCLI